LYRELESFGSDDVFVRHYLDEANAKIVDDTEFDRKAMNYDSLYTDDLIYREDGSEVKVKIDSLTLTEKNTLFTAKTPDDVKEARQEIINGRIAIKTLDAAERSLLAGLEKIRGEFEEFYNDYYRLSLVSGDIN
ncbi:20403_t:CDS:2, partial [Funneliformis geosporum]